MQTVLLLSDNLTYYDLQCSELDGLQRRMIRDENGTHFDRPSPLYDQKEFVPLEVKSGDFVVIHGDLVHQR
jgi:phytanoyl-CoA hydroxylase